MKNVVLGALRVLGMVICFSGNAFAIDPPPNPGEVEGDLVEQDGDAFIGIAEYLQGGSYNQLKEAFNCRLMGDCAGAPKMKDFAFRIMPGTLRCSAGSCPFGITSSGKLQVNMERRYGIDTDTDDDGEAWTHWKDIWHWRNNSADKYVMARHELGVTVLPSSLTTSGKLAVSMLPDYSEPDLTGTPSGYDAPYQNGGGQGIAAGATLYAGNVVSESSPFWINGELKYRHFWGEWPNDSTLIMHVRRNIRGRATLYYPNGQVGTMQVVLGKVVTRSTGSDSPNVPLKQKIAFKTLD